ncbi:MAG TPA: heme-binding protein [Motilibacterales bacterium]|nr:heme-binding protein [Motilibacterales bacterium]
MTQQQPYEPIGRWGDVEIRRYPAHTIAEVVVDGDFEDAGNRGFRPLFGYIQGQIAMTAPVVATPGEDGHSVAFVMPAGRTLDTLPPPTDARVHLRAVPEQVAAALKFSGWGTAGDLDTRGRQLLGTLEESPWQPVGPIRLARFNAPFIPPFLRHNEVVVNVTDRPTPG